MKICSFLLLVSFYSTVVVAQISPRIEKVLSGERQQIDRLTIANGSTITLLPSVFSKSDLSLSAKVEQLQSLTLVKVYYIYTRYKQSPQFDQLSLDRKRFSQLQKSFPEILTDPFIEWEIIEQTGCDSPENGTNFFHGFVLVHRPEPSSDEYRLELERLQRFLKSPTNEFEELELDLVKQQLEGTNNSTAPKEATQTAVVSTNARYIDGNKGLLTALKNSFAGDPTIVTKRVDKWVNVRFTVTRDSLLTNVQFDSNTPDNLQVVVQNALLGLNKWIPASENGQNKDTTVAMEIRVSYARDVSGMYTVNGSRPVFEQAEVEVLEKPKPDNSYAELQKTLLNASTVYKGLERLDKAEKFALVMDVTGSMSGNVAAMKRWIELRNDSIAFTSFSFFNDGDGRATRFKKLGKTGGIYTTYSEKEIGNTIETAMDKGSGGERSESDIEAVIHAQNSDSLHTAVLLIADNYSEIRDIELLPQVSVPVHILICAAPNGVREEYLNLARQTNGVLIYYGEVINVSEVRRGGTLHVGPAAYSFNGKNFKLIEKEK